MNQFDAFKELVEKEGYIVKNNIIKTPNGRYEKLHTRPFIKLINGLKYYGKDELNDDELCKKLSDSSIAGMRYVRFKDSNYITKDLDVIMKRKEVDKIPENGIFLENIMQICTNLYEDPNTTYIKVGDKYMELTRYISFTK